MALTNAQYDVLSNDILVTHQSEFPDAVSNPNDQPIVDAYNLPASPDFWVWRTSLTVREVYEAVSIDSTTWSTTLYIARSTAERDAWRDVYAIPGSFNPSLPNARAGLADIFSGAGGLAQRTHLLALGRRLATRAERLFAAGAGTTASPGTLVFEGRVTLQNISIAIRGPRP